MLNSSSQRSPAISIARKGQADDVEPTWRMFQAHLNWINVWYDTQTVVQRRDSGDLNVHRSLIEGYPSAIAEFDGTTVGFCTTEICELGVLEIRNMYVDDPYRKQGAGTLMLKEVEEQAADHEINCLIAFSSDKYYKDKLLPTGLFERCGYTSHRLGPSTEMYIKILKDPRTSFSTFAVTPQIDALIRIRPESSGPTQQA